MAVDTDDSWLDMMEGFSLFDEDANDDEDSALATAISQSLEEASCQEKTETRKKKKTLDAPPADRSCNHNIVGLQNLGATCYMNALIQSLYFTPGFKERLFRMSPTALGVPADTKDITAQTVRRIPLELQRLMGDLAMKDVSSVSTVRLTDSFGWNDRSELRAQHDVQELNRILFEAITLSLKGTHEEDLIESLYGGSVVREMICLGSCCSTNTSHREEPMQDLTVNVSGVHELSASLAQEFVAEERFEGDNQVRCPGCNVKSDATRTTKLGRIPKVLTIALNRFTYDWQRGRRQKLTSSFAFPTTLNVTPYCCDKTVSATSRKAREYVLYSVVVHGGGAGSGHYTAFVRDFAGQGRWEAPKHEKPASGLKRSSKHGPTHSGTSGDEWTTVTSGGSRKPAQGTNGDGALLHDAGVGDDGSGGDAVGRAEVAMGSATAPAWFKCNDGSVSVADETDLTSVYSGSQCAYMLFYVQQAHLDAITSENHTGGHATDGSGRSSSAEASKEDSDVGMTPSSPGEWQYQLPSHLAAAVAAENAVLQQQRQTYDAMVNAIDVDVWTPAGLCYDVDGNALLLDAGPRMESGDGDPDDDTYGINAASILPCGVVWVRYFAT